MSSFVHLHNHTEYSLLDGANRIPRLVDKAVEMGMPALAISDHGVMFGVMEFYFECLKRGVKPIIGMEAYVAPNGRKNKSGREENQTYHLLLLAKDIDGYRNLCKLHSMAALEGFYYKPRVDHELLREFRGGLIGTSACLGSEICQSLLRNDYEEAQRLAGMYKELFEEDSFFIELQDHRLSEQAAIKPQLLQIARECKLPLIATNDAHYLCKGDAASHEVLLCIGTSHLLSDPKRMRFETDEFFLKSPGDMRQLFSDTPEAIENTLRIAEMCSVELGKQLAPMPTPELPDGVDSMQHLRNLAEQGVEARLGQMGDEQRERLNYELGVIERTGFSDYFLLVREFANFTRNQGIMFGVRGSAAGSLVSFALGITDIDPLEYDITFERFLNIERIAMPDIDMDFEDARRDEVIRWVTEKYGKEHVAQIVTFGTLGARQAIKDAGRVMGFQPHETDRICKLIPGIPGMTLDRALAEVRELRAMVDQERGMRPLIDAARTVEGLARHSGVHAAGIVISKDPLMDHVPLYRGNDGQAVTAYEMGVLEKIGLLKMDFLGLSNLTVLAQTRVNIQRNRGVDIDLRAIPLDDAKAYEMLARGETTGVFQLESAGMRRNIIELKPQSIRELAAMVALYRPGPMDHIPRFVSNKFGKTKPTYLDERMRPLLEETYGVIVYQDQVLKLVQALAGFSLGKADVLRRAMGKKDVDAMQSMKVEFIAGTSANGISAATAEEIWKLLLPFAGYAFNKAHAVCYAMIAYQTAYLKANFPVEYMAALLAVYRDSEEKVVSCIEECRRQGIPVLPPEINTSFADFTIEKVTPKRKKKGQDVVDGVRFGLLAIKGVGVGLVQALIEERETAPYTSLFEFCERLRPRGMNKAALEALIKGGALDSLESNRNKLLSVAEVALAFADSCNRMKSAGQDSLFGEGEGPGDIAYPVIPEVAPPSRTEALSMERDVLGIYLSDHPLRGMEVALRKASTHTCAQVPEQDDGKEVVLAGVITSVTHRLTRATGQKMAVFQMEDQSGIASVIVSPKKLVQFDALVHKDSVVRVVGVIAHWERANTGRKQVDVRLDEISLLQEAPAADDNDDALDGTVVVRVSRATKSELQSLRQMLASRPGAYQVVVEIGSNGSTKTFEPLHRIDPTDDFVRALRSSVNECEVEVFQRAGSYLG